MRLKIIALILILAGYIVVSLVMLAPITNFRHLNSATFGSDTRLNVWTLAWVNHALLDGAPVFDANIFYPARNALAYSEHLLGISAFTLPIYATTRNPTLAYNIVWLLSYLLCAFAAHALAWRVTRDHLASFVGGVAFAFCFYRMLHGHAHLPLLWAFWIPLSLLALERWWGEPTWRRSSLLFVVVLMQLLASWYLAVMVLLADALLLTWLVVRVPPRRELVKTMAAQLTVGLALGAVALWPIARHYTFLIGAANPAEALGNSAELGDYFVPPLNTWIGHWMAARGSNLPQWIWGEKTLFLGYITSALALLGIGGLAVRQRRRDFRDGLGLGFFVLLGAVALALASGPSRNAVTTPAFDLTPFGLFSKLPAMTLFRVPARFSQLLTLSLAVLAAAGAKTLHAHFGRIGRAVTLLLVPLLLSEWYLVDFPGGAPQPEEVPFVYRQLAHLPARAVVSLPDYIGGPEWFREADYQFYSTTHWHPIVNGYSRTEPPDYKERMAAIATFPSPESVRTLRTLGVDYVVLHGKRYREDVGHIVNAARGNPDLTLTWQSGFDYLFQVMP